MNLGKVSLGLVVLFTGVILLLENMDVLNFNWSSVIYFWPLLIILIGINILLPKRIEGQILSIMATIVVLIFFLFQGLKPSSLFGDVEMKEINSSGQTSTFSHEYTNEIKIAHLTISGGAVKYEIAQVSNKLIDIEAHSLVNSFSLSTRVSEDKATLDFTQKGKGTLKQKGLKSENRATIRLNPNPIWDINLEIGAGAADFDLKAFKIRNLTIEGGVSSVKLVLGMPAENKSIIDFEGGVSSLDIKIPKEASCLIRSESALSSLKFPGFIKQEDGTYINENYTSTSKRFEITLENGLSSIKVSRY